MNRFDRVTAILLLLQTRPIITAQFLSEHFNVSERTIYRDIRTLENAGVPIGSEAGVGYFLDRGYRLPPVAFTLDEAAALLLGEKLLTTSLDDHSLQDFKQALNKVRAVLRNSDKDYLSSFDADIEVLPTGTPFPTEQDASPTNPSPAVQQSSSPAVQQSNDRWLRECRQALMNCQVAQISYSAQRSQQDTTRQIEPIGLFYYSWHWHLIAWCRLREDYRDFRLDRISAFTLQPERFVRHTRLTLQQYLNEHPGQEDLEEVELMFGVNAARFVEEQKYMFGYIDEERLANGIKMRFLTQVPEYMARWLLQYIDDVEVRKGDGIRQALQTYAAQLHQHWNASSKAS